MRRSLHSNFSDRSVRVKVRPRTKWFVIEVIVAVVCMNIVHVHTDWHRNVVRFTVRVEELNDVVPAGIDSRALFEKPGARRFWYFSIATIVSAAGLVVPTGESMA